jgi:thiosulfate/3-mercaptopyruvate sulfurtransferase
VRRRLLVSVDELSRELAADRPPVLLDVRWRLVGPPGEVEYDAGHLPGASYVDLDRDLADPARPDHGGGRHPLPDPARFGAAMRAAGVRRGRGVVVYDDAGGTTAARLWWLLTHHGHRDVRLLDGGLAAWRDAGIALDTERPDVSPGDWEPVVPGLLPVLDADAAAAVATDGVLLDARAGERYRGETEPVDPVAGHVPGAVSVPSAEWLDADGRMLAAEQILARLAELGVSEGVDVATYCGSGVVASHTVLALATAGVDAALYAGSWSDWTSDPGRPVATGPSR